MKNQEWTFEDKKDWGEGEWQNEPDKAQWTDEATGLPCLAVRNFGGAWCGYVGVDESHPFYGIGYSVVYEREGFDDSVHGGLTFSAFCTEGDKERGICHIPEPGEPDDVWWLGFDCAHWNDYSPRHYIGLPGKPANRMEVYRNLDYVKSECASLARQLSEVRTL